MTGRPLALVVLGGFLRLGVLAVVAASAPAYAQEDGTGGEGAEGDTADEGKPPEVVKDPKAAKKWHSAGQQLVQKGDAASRRNKAAEAKTHYENAAVSFQKAIDAGAEPNVYYDLALAEEKLGKPDAAARHLRVVIAASGIKADILKKARARFDALTMLVGLVTLEVDPDGAIVSLADAELGRSPFKEPLIFAPGTYTLSLAADGYQPMDVEIKVEEGSEVERKVTLEPIKMVVTKPRPVKETPTTVVAPAGPSRLPLYVSGGVTVVALGVSVATGLLAKGQHDTYIAPESTRPQRDAAQTDGKRFALMSDIALGTAVVAAGFTAYWYLVKYKPARVETEVAARAGRQESRAMAKVRVVPWVQLEAGGLSVAGAF